MNFFKPFKSTSNLVCSLCALLAVSLIGCSDSDSDGGLIGTGSGPTYELVHLPNRISPDLPKTLLKGKETSPSDFSDGNTKESLGSLRNQIIHSGKSQGWLELNNRLGVIELTRLGIQSNATIVDLAFDDILNECAEQLLDCTIPADRIRITLTQDVVNRLIELHTDWIESTSLSSYSASVSASSGVDGNVIVTTTVEEDDEVPFDTSKEKIRNFFVSLLNTEVLLGETHYSQLDGAPYDHAIRTTIKRGINQSDDFSFPFWTDEEFAVNWHEDGQVAKFLSGSAESATHEYFYQNNVPSELVVSQVTAIDDEGYEIGLYTKILGNDPDQAGVLLEAAYLGVIYDSSFPIVERAFDVLRGQWNNSGGFSTVDERVFDISENQNLTGHISYRESYDRIGELLAGERCFPVDIFQVNSICGESVFVSYGPEGSSITDSVHYFAPGEFDSLASVQDAIRWKLEGVPSEIKSVAVVSAESQSALAESELLCRGVQNVGDDALIFCSATDEQLDNTVVVELVDGIPSGIISTAKLVQIQ